MTWEQFVAACIPTPHTVMVEVYAGAGAFGDQYADPVEVSPCVVEDITRTVTVQTGDAEGEERLSSTTVYAPLSPTVPPGSLITLPAGRRARVLAVECLDAHGHVLPEHQELSLE